MLFAVAELLVIIPIPMTQFPLKCIFARDMTVTVVLRNPRYFAIRDDANASIDNRRLLRTPPYSTECLLNSVQ